MPTAEPAISSKRLSTNTSHEKKPLLGASPPTGTALSTNPSAKQRASPSGAVGEKLAANFPTLAHRIADDTNPQAEMKLTVDNGAAFALLVEAVSAIIDTAVTDGELTGTPTTRRPAWNLCADTVGAAQTSATLRVNMSIPFRSSRAGQVLTVIATLW
ncbi:hypothetical protein LQL77_30550 [Rhodococcus cerastii]|nr:hypothetical protein [Rhodococcus cerastii]